MASLWSTGPVNIFIGYAGSAPVFLGHGEKAPRISIKPRYVPVVCDLGGEEPMEDLKSGESGTVDVELIRWNYGVLNGIKARTRSAVFPNAVPGTEAPGELGTLMQTEGASYMLYLQFSRAGNPIFGAGGAGGAMPAGYRFLAAFLDPEGGTAGAAAAHKTALTWQCRRAFTPASSSLGTGAFKLYDYVMDGLPAIN